MTQTRRAIREILSKMDPLNGLNVDAWLSDLMQIPALRLAEKAEEKPEYRLAVVDSADIPDQVEMYGGGTDYRLVPMKGYRRVIAVEEG